MILSHAYCVFSPAYMIGFRQALKFPRMIEDLIKELLNRGDIRLFILTFESSPESKIEEGIISVIKNFCETV